MIIFKENNQNKSRIPLDIEGLDMVLRPNPEPKTQCITGKEPRTDVPRGFRIQIGYCLGATLKNASERQQRCKSR